MTMTLILLILIISAALAFCLCVDNLGHRNSGGCTSPFILPDKPFLVIWNYPTDRCAAKGVNLNFEKWGIVDNSYGKFYGEQINLFYNLGQFPRFSGSAPINGGIPQLGDLASHLEKVESDINSTIGSQYFSGLGVIDFESWRPILWLNYDSLKIYKEKSLELAKERFPSYNGTQLMQEAIKEFNNAARSFLETTLQKVSFLRPDGKWGFYGYPRCWDSYCNSSTVQINDMISWIYNTSTGLYPSIYFSNNWPPNVTAVRVKNIILETLRVKATWSHQDTAILPYSLMQESTYDFFSLADLANAIHEPADMGSSGVVLWGSYTFMTANNECLALQDYINSTLGPFALQVTHFFANCSHQLCHGHGRCVRNDYEHYYQYHLQKSGRTECSVSAASIARLANKARMAADKNMNKKTHFKKDYIFQFRNDKSRQHWNGQFVFANAGYDDKFYDFDDYTCRCFAGWSGTHCEVPKIE